MAVKLQVTASLVTALCLSQMTTSSPHPLSSVNLLKPRPFRLEGPTPLPPTAPDYSSPIYTPILTSSSPRPLPFAIHPSPSGSATRPVVLVTSRPSRPATQGKQNSKHRQVTSSPKRLQPSSRRQGKIRDQQSTATEERIAALRSPLALRLLQEAYVHSAAQDAVASTSVRDAPPRPLFRPHRPFHPTLPPPPPPSTQPPPPPPPPPPPRPVVIEKSRALPIPTPEAARLLASAVNHNLIAETPRPVSFRPIYVSEVASTPQQPGRLPLTAAADLELRQAAKSLRFQQPQEYVIQDTDILHLQPDLHNVHRPTHNQQFLHQVDIQQLNHQIQQAQQLNLEQQHNSVQQHSSEQQQRQPADAQDQDQHSSSVDNHQEREELSEHQELGEEPEDLLDTRYDYTYRVRDVGGNNFGHSERRSGERTWGQYFVHLPDGRLKTVRYWADDTGYHAEVEYEGSATHPKESVPTR